MSTDKRNQQEEEFEEYFSSEKGAWTNAWSPTWEDTRPSLAVSFDSPVEDLPEGYDLSAPSEQEDPE
jgi:hypothetical protein